MRTLFPAVYIMANKRNGVLYTGITADLIRRTYEHREALYKSFTKRYNCKLLVYYEYHEEIITAIEREKAIKAGSRKQKLQLIEIMNPNWNDLYSTIT